MTETKLVCISSATCARQKYKVNQAYPSSLLRTCTVFPLAPVCMGMFYIE